MLVLIIVFLSLILALMTAYTLAFQGTTYTIGRLLVGATEGAGVQDAITPRSQTGRNIVMFSLIAILFVISALYFRWYYGLLIIVVSIMAGSVFGNILGFRPGSQRMIKAVTRSMMRRYDAYRREGDELRAEAIQELIERMRDISVADIQNEAMKYKNSKR